MNKRLLALLALTWACGSTPLGGPAPDAGTSPADGGPPVADGGTVADGGAPPADGGGGTGVGSACSDASACPGGFCLSQAETGFPGGYCTASCDGAACPAGSICQPDFSVCLQGCSAAACRPGYTCTPLDIGAVCIPGTPGASIGDACSDSGACPVGGFCVTEGSGFPGGYCSRACTPGGSECGEGATCVDIDGPGELSPVCLQSCRGDGDCRAPGYVCEGTWFVPLPTRSCVPGTRDPVSAGAACRTLGDCPPGWFCAGPADGFPGGYCTRTCGAGQAPCPPDSFCAASLGFCLDGCTQDRDCRESYACTNRLFGIPLARRTCVPFREGAHVGDACATAADCTLGGFCIQPQDPQGSSTGFAGGYCSASCGPQSPCPAGSVCQRLENLSLCLDGCEANGDCRQAEGYVCRDVPMGERVCAPPE